jgi:hypothetical protein
LNNPCAPTKLTTIEQYRIANPANRSQCSCSKLQYIPVNLQS